ncbi:hypothetical protein [Microbacterium alcoholitolerans]|uniref:hypothetical protein n=1 Tax=unclassified Microbacterium TaxID=2609290 RepID=UPI003D17FF6B
MSENLETPSPSGSGTPPHGSSGKVEEAGHEAADLKDSAASQAKDVLDTAKHEAAGVVGEAKMQAKDLYAQTQRELKEQAGTQQQRLAAGLRSVGDELGSMASNSDGNGIASDLVQQVSGRVSAAANWLGERDPGSVLNEVKRYARRKPGTFILAAAIGGIVVGRLTRALASAGSDEKQASAPSVPPPVAPPTQVVPDPSMPVPVSTPTATGTTAETPLHTQTRSTRAGALGEEDGYDRPDTL